jgi:hypothetical protein
MMPDLTFQDIEAAIRSSWSLETCDPTDVSSWSPSNPARGQCAATALVVHDLVGGELLEAEVLFPDGARQGFHYWNRLAGVDVDLTREQFTSGELVQESRLIDRHSPVQWLAHGQYLLLRDRVHEVLKLPRPGG